MVVADIDHDDAVRHVRKQPPWKIGDGLRWDRDENDFSGLGGVDNGNGRRADGNRQRGQAFRSSRVRNRDAMAQLGEAARKYPSHASSADDSGSHGLILPNRRCPRPPCQDLSCHEAPRSSLVVPQFQLSILMSFGSGAPFPVSTSDFRLIRKTAHLVVHELHRLLPTLVLEEHDGEVALLLEIETHLRSDPLFGPLDHLPEHALAGIELEHLHVEAAGPEAELENSADLALALRVGRPPRGEPFARGQCLVGVVQGRLDSDSVQMFTMANSSLLLLVLRRLPIRPGPRRGFPATS